MMIEKINSVSRKPNSPPRSASDLHDSAGAVGIRGCSRDDGDAAARTARAVTDAKTHGAAATARRGTRSKFNGAACSAVECNRSRVENDATGRS